MTTTSFKKSLLFRGIAYTVLLAFVGLLPAQPSYAQVAIIMPPPGQMIHITQHFEPPQMVGLKVDLKDPFSFNFIMDQGQTPMNDDVKKEEFNKIIKYFLVSLAMPNRDMWVNLSPYESNRLIPQVFAQTEMGRDLLAQDYILKQFTASLMYPEDGLGKKFWNDVYAKAQARFGTTEINVNTFNKVWIVADRADIYQKDDTAFLIDSHLKVMLEQDYKAISKNKEMFGTVQAVTTDETQDAKTKMASDLVRQIIIPAIEKEVNEGRSFAAVRQVYNAEIMATWFKRTLQASLLGQVFADKGKISGQRIRNPQEQMQSIYHEYLRAYKKGVFNYIREDATPDGQTIPRKYFSGGLTGVQAAMINTITPAMLDVDPKAKAEVDNFAQSTLSKIGRYVLAAVGFNTMDGRHFSDTRRAKVVLGIMAGVVAAGGVAHAADQHNSNGVDHQSLDVSHVHLNNQAITIDNIHYLFNPEVLPSANAHQIGPVLINMDNGTAVAGSAKTIQRIGNQFYHQNRNNPNLYWTLGAVEINGRMHHPSKIQQQEAFKLIPILDNKGRVVEFKTEAVSEATIKAEAKAAAKLAQQRQKINSTFEKSPKAAASSAPTVHLPSTVYVDTGSIEDLRKDKNGVVTAVAPMGIIVQSGNMDTKYTANPGTKKWNEVGQNKTVKITQNGDGNFTIKPINQPKAPKASAAAPAVNPPAATSSSYWGSNLDIGTKIINDGYARIVPGTNNPNNFTGIEIIRDIKGIGQTGLGVVEIPAGTIMYPIEGVGWGVYEAGAYTGKAYTFVKDSKTGEWIAKTVGSAERHEKAAGIGLGKNVAGAAEDFVNLFGARIQTPLAKATKALDNTRQQLNIVSQKVDDANQTVASLSDQLSKKTQEAADNLSKGQEQVAAAVAAGQQQTAKAVSAAVAAQADYDAKTMLDLAKKLSAEQEKSAALAYALGNAAPAASQPGAQAASVPGVVAAAVQQAADVQSTIATQVQAASAAADALTIRNINLTATPNPDASTQRQIQTNADDILGLNNWMQDLGLASGDLDAFKASLTDHGVQVEHANAEAARQAAALRAAAQHQQDKAKELSWWQNPKDQKIAAAIALAIALGGAGLYAIARAHGQKTPAAIQAALRANAARIATLNRQLRRTTGTLNRLNKRLNILLTRLNQKFNQLKLLSANRAAAKNRAPITRIDADIQQVRDYLVDHNQAISNYDTHGPASGLDLQAYNATRIEREADETKLLNLLNQKVTLLQAAGNIAAARRALVQARAAYADPIIRQLQEGMTRANATRTRNAIAALNRFKATGNPAMKIADLLKELKALGVKADGKMMKQLSVLPAKTPAPAPVPTAPAKAPKKAPAKQGLFTKAKAYLANKLAERQKAADRKIVADQLSDGLMLHAYTPGNADVPQAMRLLDMWRDNVRGLTADDVKSLIGLLKGLLVDFKPIDINDYTAAGLPAKAAGGGSFTLPPKPANVVEMKAEIDSFKTKVDDQKKVTDQAKKDLDQAKIDIEDAMSKHDLGKAKISAIDLGRAQVYYASMTRKKLYLDARLSLLRAQSKAKPNAKETALMAGLPKAITNMVKADPNVDKASISTPHQWRQGGINLSDENLVINIKVDGAGMPLPAQYQDAAMLNISGLTSIIKRISPLTPQNVPALYDLLK